MIKIIQVNRVGGEILITFNYDRPGEDPPQLYTVTVRAEEIHNRLREVKKLLGRPLTAQDLRQVTITLINELREGRKPLLETFRYEDYIGLDLEAQT
ncbi:MAG: hypothetical protein QXF26_05455 [Candidatus Bathyarchaeia archaeon]